MKNTVLSDFTKVFTVIPDSLTKVKSSSYLESGKYAVVDQGKDLIAGYTNTPPTVDEYSLPVIVFGDHTRAVKYVDFPFAAGADGTQILKPSPLAIPKYCFYLVMNAVAKIPSKGYARHFGELKKMPFPIPSPEKQHEIVKRLDRAFAEIDLLRENLDSMESLINECDASLLGKSLGSNIGKLGGYRSSTLGEVTELISRGISPSYLDSAKMSVLNQRCIRDGHVDLNFSRRHDEKAKKVQETKLLQNGDGLINSTGVGTLGRTALFDHPGIGDFTVDSHVTIIRPKSETLDRDYFGLVLRALEHVFVALSTGTSGQTELPREAIKETSITFPENLSDQKDFFNYYNSINFAISEFRKVLIKKRVLAESLCASLLSSAFTEVEEVA